MDMQSLILRGYNLKAVGIFSMQCILNLQNKHQLIHFVLAMTSSLCDLKFFFQNHTIVRTSMQGPPVYFTMYIPK